jgi:hypothetical protein
MPWASLLSMLQITVTCPVGRGSSSSAMRRITRSMNHRAERAFALSCAAGAEIESR